MPLLYAESSALVKLVKDEPESGALRAYVAGADVVSSELVLTEVPRAIRRAAADAPDVFFGGVLIAVMILLPTGAAGLLRRVGTLRR